MSLVTIPPLLYGSRIIANATGKANAIMDATGESRGVIGRVRFADGATGTKTISTSGGAIIWMTGATNTFANGATKFRIGVQDVDAATGLEDGTFDVYAELTGGVATITDNAYINSAMTNGSKTVTQGDVIAIVGEMTVRAGADVVRMIGLTLFGPAAAGIFPYGTADTGSLGKVNTVTVVILKFDDGTYGWVDTQGNPAPIVGTVATSGLSLTYFNSGSTPDEYGAAFRLPFKAKLGGFALLMDSIGASATFDLTLFGDPFGTPTALAGPFSINPLFTNSAASTGWYIQTLPTAVELSTNTDYAVTIRPTSANDVGIGYETYGSGFDFLKTLLPISTVKLISRTDNTGAFSEVQPYYMPAIFLMFTALDDGAGSGSGFVGIIGG